MTKKVFISVDMEGVTGVVHFDEVERNKSDFMMFRKLMTAEVNAAINGALEAGASDIIVRDAHDEARNILPEELNKSARLLRGWADSPLSMMEGIDNSYNAVMFVGYHAPADTPDGTLSHTMSMKIAELKVNDVVMAEAGLNALIAGMFDVPVVFVSGDKATCDYTRDTLGEIETVVVKEGIGAAAINLHPEISRELIQLHSKKALEKLDRFSPFKLSPPYEFKIRYRYEYSAYKAHFYPGVKRLSSNQVAFRSNDLSACLTFLFFCLG
ncbi:MAG: M55 family metallopeptidase [bacterium]